MEFVTRFLAAGLVTSCLTLTLADEASGQYPVGVTTAEPVGMAVVGYAPERRGLFGRRIVYRPVLAPVTVNAPVTAPVTVARPAMVPVAPVTSYYAPSVQVAAPVTSYYAPSVAVPVTTYRVPVTTYRMPVRSYRVPVTPCVPSF